MAWLEYSWKPTHLGSFNSIQNSSIPIVTLEVKVPCAVWRYMDPQYEDVLTDGRRSY